MSSHLARVKRAGDKDTAPAETAPARASGAKRPFSRETETDAAWCLRYEAEYESLSQRGRQERAERRQHERRRGAAPATDCEAAFADIQRERRRSRQALIDLRWSRGFVWSGGTFAGSDVYRREPFRCVGLVSDRHPLLKLFAAKVPRVKRLRIGDHKGSVYRTDSKLLGLDAAYVEDNKRCCGVLRIEVDAVLPWVAVAEACKAAGVPLPNIVVGWEDAQGRLHHPHLLWLLHASLPLEGERCGRFRSLYRGVLRGLVKALLPIGADPGGLMNSHRHKNPLCPLWHTRILAGQPYDLGTLREHVDVTVRLEALRRTAAELRGYATPAPDHPDAAVAASSNRLFAKLAMWARRELVRVRAAGGAEEEFAVLVAEEACRLAGALTGDARRAEPVALATAAKVARWTWHIYRAPASARVTADAAELAGRHAEGGRKAAARRRARSEEVIVAAALGLAERLGRAPTQVEVLAAVASAGIRGEKTIRRHWDAVRSAMAGREQMRTEADHRSDAVPHVKKGPAASAQAKPPSFPPRPPAFLVSSGTLRPRLPVPAFLVRANPAPAGTASAPEVGAPVPGPATTTAGPLSPAPESMCPTSAAPPIIGPAAPGPAPHCPTLDRLEESRAAQAGGRGFGPGAQATPPPPQRPPDPSPTLDKDSERKGKRRKGKGRRTTALFSSWLGVLDFLAHRLMNAVRPLS